MSPESSPQRIHALDHVRAFALLLGVVYHAAHAYSAKLHIPWMVREADGSWLLFGFEQLSHLFRMPLFYFLAGFFAKMLIEKRGALAFSTNRMVRIALPFALFLPPIALSFLFIGRWAQTVLGEAPPMMTPADGSPRVAHLWFLEYLALFYVVTLLLRALPRPRFDLWRPVHFAWLPLLLVPALWFADVPVRAPIEMAPTLWPFGYYGAFFALGYLVFGEQAFIERIPAAPLALFTALAFPTFLWLLLEHPSQRLPLVLLEAYLSLALSLLTLWAGARWFAAERRWGRYLSDASYWIYLVHLPIVLWLQVWLAPLHWHLWVKFAACLGGTLALCLGSYALFVRYTPIGLMLNGRRRRLG